MKIAIASEKDKEDGEISERAGRCKFYLIFEDKKLVKKIKNPFSLGAGGAGWSVAYMLAEEKADLVIAGRIGPNMKMALKEKKVKFKETLGKIKQVLETFKK